MSLNGTTKAILDAAAKAIYCNQKIVDLDLSLIEDAFEEDLDAIVDYLAEKVLELSDGSRTIRRADEALFQNKVGIDLYLVCCPAATSDDTVMSLGDDMRLSTVSVHYGVVTDPRTATTVSIQRYREEMSRRAHEFEMVMQPKRFVDELTAALDKKVREYVALHGDEEVERNFSGLLGYTDPMDLLEIAQICQAVGTTLVDLARTI